MITVTRAGNRCCVDCGTSICAESQGRCRRCSIAIANSLMAKRLRTVEAPMEDVWESAKVKGERLPGQEVLAQLLDYDPVTGSLAWKPRPSSMFRDGRFGQDGNAQRWNSKWAGQQALSAKNSNGYGHGQLFGRDVSAHRVIFKLLHNLEPDEVDHINGDRIDNRAVNLRASSRAQNAKNCARSIRNTNGFVGIQFDIRRGHYTARVGSKYCGHFRTLDEAVAARRQKLSAFGYSDRHGEPR